MVLISMFSRNKLFYLERITTAKPFPNIPMTPMTYKNDNDKIFFNFLLFLKEILENPNTPTEHCDIHVYLFAISLSHEKLTV